MHVLSSALVLPLCPVSVAIVPVKLPDNFTSISYGTFLVKFIFLVLFFVAGSYVATFSGFLKTHSSGLFFWIDYFSLLSSDLLGFFMHLCLFLL